MANRVKMGGRKAGTPNKATVQFRDAVNRLLEHATPHMIRWLDRIAEDDPYKALSIVDKLAEFANPKLSRQEVQALDENGDKASGFNITVKHVKPDA